MKKQKLRIAALVALAFASCQKTETVTTEVKEEESTPIVETTPAPATPKPISVATPAPTPAPELAPPGRYFARRKLSIETDAGIIGIPAGTALDQTGPGQYRTLDGQTVAATDGDVTNRLDGPVRSPARTARCRPYCEVPLHLT